MVFKSVDNRNMVEENMRIGLIDVDGHNFPNLPLMKLSAWHKQHDDSFAWRRI